MCGKHFGYLLKINNHDIRTTPSSVSIVNFKHVIAGWVVGV